MYGGVRPNLRLATFNNSVGQFVKCVILAEVGPIKSDGPNLEAWHGICIAPVPVLNYHSDILDMREMGFPPTTMNDLPNEGPSSILRTKAVIWFDLVLSTVDQMSLRVALLLLMSLLDKRIIGGPKVTHPDPQPPANFKPNTIPRMIPEIQPHRTRTHASDSFPLLISAS